MPTVYDQIGRTYTSTRRADPRIAAFIANEVPPGASVLNVGAGAGSYEPVNNPLVAVEPSRAMIAQRGARSAPVVCAVAEALPFATRSVDIVLGVLTTHHWTALKLGLDECLRIARRRLVFLTWDAEGPSHWLIDQYLPNLLDHSRDKFPSMRELSEMLGGARVLNVPIPHDCTDGFLGAYWRRPAAYLDATVRQSISAFALAGNADESLARLDADLHSGAWERKYGHLLSLDALDLGYRLVVADVA